MSITVTGIIEKKAIGTGTWALIGDDSKTYELKGTTAELRQPNQKVSITGIIRDDVMTLAAIGPVLEVESFVVIS